MNIYNINFKLKLMKPLIQFLIVLSLFTNSFQITCSSGYAFNTVTGVCEYCTNGYNSDSQSCIVCSQGLALINGTCQACTDANTAPSKDKTQCISCDNVDETTRECQSTSGLVYDKLVTGYYSDKYLIYEIDNYNASIPIPAPYPSCIGGYLDSNYRCQCDTGYVLNEDDNTCYSSSYTKTKITQMQYFYLEDGNRYKSSPLFDSSLFKTYSQQGIAGCQNKIEEKCQLLANYVLLECTIKLQQNVLNCYQFKAT